MKDIFLLVKQEIDFTTIYGVYDDYLKAEEDYTNAKKYIHMYKDAELNIYKLDINKFYNNDYYEKVL